MRSRRGDDLDAYSSVPDRFDGRNQIDVDLPKYDGLPDPDPDVPWDDTVDQSEWLPNE